MAFITNEEIQAYQPDSLPQEYDAMETARRLMEKAGLWKINQQMGSRWPIGCVALEITQRCNLDCTLCYLSEHSEAVQDLPLPEIFRRIDMIRQYYGEHTDVQITGGEPTLRKRTELLAIVRRVRELDMRPTLMTNGIKATRDLLEDLVAAGLIDVVFHVDTTQEIKGYGSESELNVIRQKYIDRVRGLPLSVMFNTTVHHGNFDEIPELVRFFAGNADIVRTASFQLQADTGRGVQGKRDAVISIDTVAGQIQQGAGTVINFDATGIGHPSCNRYGLCLETDGKLYDLLDDTVFIGRIQSASAHLRWDRTDNNKTARTFIRWLLSQPRHWLPGLCWLGRRFWQIKSDLIAAKGKINTISFLIHNFMDACALERERIDDCAFKTMTAQGPLSMCLHNAKRDDYILQPVALQTENDLRYWQPLSGSVSVESSSTKNTNPTTYSIKRLKGRSRQQTLAQKANASKKSI